MGKWPAYVVYVLLRDDPSPGFSNAFSLSGNDKVLYCEEAMLTLFLSTRSTRGPVASRKTRANRQRQGMYEYPEVGRDDHKRHCDKRPSKSDCPLMYSGLSWALQQPTIKRNGQAVEGRMDWLVRKNCGPRLPGNQR